MMLQDRVQQQFGEEYPGLNHELKQYKKINFSLRKKIKEKDHKIQQLFGYIQDASKQYGYSPEYSLIKSQPPAEKHHKFALSENRKKEKQNKGVDYFEQSNIFKHPSNHFINKISKEQLHLPTLEKKSKNIFQEDSPDNPERKGRVVRLPIERLKPLDSDEVRKRFLMKYGKSDE